MSLSNIFSLVYFGNPLILWIYALIIVIVFVIFSRITLYFSKNVLTKLTSKTKNDFDDILVDLIEEPFAFLLTVIGFLVAYQVLVFDSTINDFFYNAIKLLIMLDVSWFVIRFIDSFFERIIKPITSKTKTKLDDQLVPWLKKSMKITVMFLAIIIILDNMGIDVMALLAGLGIGGIAFAFAAQKTIADAFGGISILFSRPFVIGDTIKFSNGAYTGTVEEINLRYTKIRDLDKQLVIVPNSILSGEIITNVTGALKKKVVWTIGVTYDTPNKKIELAKKIIEKAIKNCEYCDSDFTIALEGFGESSINILVVFFTKRGVWKDMVLARDEVGFEIKKEFEKAKIEFAFPTQTIYTKKC
ncbi:MAG: mechanosensitive ion channel family protein [Candidatus ainarchaeum sp.]|nr:mechanosensitive ion channel family protein [Candidatus ainarchaeum sp.]